MIDALVTQVLNSQCVGYMTVDQECCTYNWSQCCLWNVLGNYSYQLMTFMIQFYRYYEEKSLHGMVGTVKRLREADPDYGRYYVPYH